jgi:hypothetical protein
MAAKSAEAWDSVEFRMYMATESIRDAVYELWDACDTDEERGALVAELVRLVEAVKS